MSQFHPEQALASCDSNHLTIRQLVEHRLDAIALPESATVPAYSAFGPSHSHRIWRVMSALTDAMPEWADAVAYEQAREKMLRHGFSRGMTLEELYALSDPDAVLGLWTAADAKDAET